MKKTHISIFIIVLIQVLILGCSQQPQADNQNENVVIVSNEDVQESDQTSDENIPESQYSNIKKFDMIAKQWEFVPDTIEVNLGDTVELHVKSVDVSHGFALQDFDINERLDPGEDVTITFVADKQGTFPFFCSVPCGSGHRSMTGQLVIH